jgi:hypothetical protein
VRTLVAAACLLAGCDVMFKIKPLDAPDPPDASPACGTPDEDGDCIADDVDNCPGIANAQQLATGEPDTVHGAGDACDPEPSTRGNTIKRFIGFNDPPADMATWEPVSTWSFDDGQLTKVTASSFGIVRLLDIDDDAEIAIEAKFIYRGADPAAIDTRIGLWVDITLGDMYGGQSCWITPDGKRLYAQERMDAMPSGTAQAVDLAPLADGATVVIQMRRDRTGGVLYCAATIDGARSDVTPVAASGTWLTMGHVGLQAARVLADVQYVAVYTR